MTTIASVVDFGAVGDGGTDDTAAFETAIKILQENGGGILVVTSNRYLIRPINLTSHMVLELQADTTILGMADEDAWPVIQDAPNTSLGPHLTSLIHGDHLENVTIQGYGNSSVVDGQGAYWWDKAHKNTLKYKRGRMIEFFHSRDVSVFDIRMVNAPYWNNHFFDCDNVHVARVAIEAPEHSPNTDGWDPNSSRNVLIEDSHYAAGDDCVAIKSGWDCYGVDYDTPSVNITVRNVTCHGFSAGIAIGSEMSGGISNVTVQHVRFTKANKPVDIKVSKKRGGYVRDVVYRDIHITGSIQRAIHVDMYHYNDSPNPACSTDWTPPTMTDVSNLTFLRFNGTDATFAGNPRFPDEAFHLLAYDQSPVRNVYMQDLYFSTPASGVGWNCSAVHGVIRNNSVTPWPPCEGFTIVDASDDSGTGLINAYAIRFYQHASCSAQRSLLFWLSLAMSVLFVRRSQGRNN
jgi:polygalacturonase